MLNLFTTVPLTMAATGLATGTGTTAGPINTNSTGDPNNKPPDYATHEVPVNNTGAVTPFNPQMPQLNPLMAVAVGPMPKQRLSFRNNNPLCGSDFFQNGGYSTALQGKLTPEEFEQRFHRVNEIMSKTVWRRWWQPLSVILPIVGFIPFMLSLLLGRQFPLPFFVGVTILAGCLVVSVFVVLVFSMLSQSTTNYAIIDIVNEFNAMDHGRGIYWRFHWEWHNRLVLDLDVI